MTNGLARVWISSLVVIGVTLIATGCSRRENPDRQPPMPSEGVTVFVGPRFYTGDPDRPWADGVVVHEGRIVRLLTRHEVPRTVAQGAREVVVPGALAVPGLVDAHAHLLGLGEARRGVDLVGTTSIEEALTRVEKFAREHPDDPWIVGRGWDQNDWKQQEWPSADRLDQVVGDRPVALSRIDGHALWVNRAALASAEIDETTSDPPGGKIHRDAAARPTGILVDAAAELVARAIPPASDKMLAESLELAGDEAARVGLTGVHDMGIDDRVLETMISLARAGRFPLRVTAYATDGSPLHQRLLESGPIVHGRIRVIGVKLYADGALGSRGARLLEPYSDQPESRGLWVTNPDELQRKSREAAARGLQIAVHAIGDAANREALGAARAALEESLALDASSAGASLRPRIEHAQIVAREDIVRFREVAEEAHAASNSATAPRTSVAVIASMQPTHATSDMPWAESRVGEDRLQGAYAWRSMLDARVPLAFGSDFPVESPDPRLGLYAAVTRRDRYGQPPGGFLPQEALTLEEALAAFTRGAAFAAGQEREAGVLAPGRFADFTIFARDPFSEPPAGLPDNPISATIIGGDVIFPRP